MHKGRPSSCIGTTHQIIVGLLLDLVLAYDWY
jgi:hypothetical protein